MLLSKRKRSMVDADRMNVPQGSLDWLVLKTLARDTESGAWKRLTTVVSQGLDTP